MKEWVEGGELEGGKEEVRGGSLSEKGKDEEARHKEGVENGRVGDSGGESHGDIDAEIFKEKLNLAV